MLPTDFFQNAMKRGTKRVRLPKCVWCEVAMWQPDCRTSILAGIQVGQQTRTHGQRQGAAFKRLITDRHIQRERQVAIAKGGAIRTRILVPGVMRDSAKCVL